MPVLLACLLWALYDSPASSHAAEPAPVARDRAPFDLSGYWVALVTEDWRYRMRTAVAGDWDGISLTEAGQVLAKAWSPEADIASGSVCKAYGAGGLMRMPTRLHLTWLSDNVLSLATDAGRQTRLFKFGPARDQIGIGSLQGVSHARWELDGDRGGSGSLVVDTSRMAPGYVRRNGIPYGDQATLTEYFEVLEGADGTDYLVVISVLEDPRHLAVPVVTSSNFRREKDGARWAPSDCEP